MTEMEKELAREALVKKSNELIQKSRFDLSVVQQKVVLFIISKIKPWDDEFTLYEFSISDFCELCGIDNDNGGNYTALKKAIKEIADKSVWIRLEDGRETLVRWIEKPYIEPKSGVVRIKLDKDMMPYLLNLQKNYTQYELGWTIKFRSKYAIRLYELICSVHYYELEAYEKVYDLEDLVKRMGAESYTEWKNIKARILEPAIAEINAYSNKKVEYTTITRGKKVIQVKLKITSKDILEALKARNGD